MVSLKGSRYAPVTVKKLSYLNIYENVVLYLFQFLTLLYQLTNFSQSLFF